MATTEIQIHGYRKGHQLLASSVTLPKDDQAVIDRLSDVAGPLRPKEQFSPYLSAYPLPSGRYFVIARTWQDPTVPRAGCVRTKSVLVPAQAWAFNPPLVSILRLLDPTRLPSDADALTTDLEAESEQELPPLTTFNANELLEALFLEDVKPIVMFDAPNPEAIAVRLLVALWPEIRKRFSLSTFALSPRTIGGRDLDLVFAPLNAKAKFSDWPGRRIDGRSTQAGRHRWTGVIVRRVFEDPVPKLLAEREIGLFDSSAADTAGALRIALLWDELIDKMEQSPTAALGLLDIANSGKVSNSAAMKLLEPRLAKATLRTSSLPSIEAWEFVGAIARKIQDSDMPTVRVAVEQVVEQLAARAPYGAISLLCQPDPKGAIMGLTTHIAAGLGNGAAPQVEQVLVEAPTDIFLCLASRGGALVKRIAEDDELIRKMALVLTEASNELAFQAGMAILPHLLEDRHINAAIPIFNRLEADQIAEELGRLGQANDFQSERLSSMLVTRAHKIKGLPVVREALISSHASVRRDAILAQTLLPIKTDVLWLMEEKRLPEMTITKLLVWVLEQASDRQLATLLSDSVLAEHVAGRLQGDAIDILIRTIMQNDLPIDAYISLLLLVIPQVCDSQRVEIASRALGPCLRNRFNDGDAILSMLLGALGARLDAAWAVTTALDDGLAAEIVSRNVIALEKAPLAARERVVGAIYEMAYALRRRNSFDLAEAAYDSCARLMLDAEITAYKTLINAAGLLMPSLLRARQQPVSLMIAALFPVVYQELAKDDDVPDVLKFFPFFDWDRCKSARHELVFAFMGSSWRAGDLALTACRCGDVTRILKRVAKSYGGGEYLERIEEDLDHLGEETQLLVKEAIALVRSNGSHKLDW